MKRKPKKPARKPKDRLQSPEPRGGLGGDVSLDPAKPSDRRLILLALRSGWPVTPEVKAKVIAETVKAMEAAAKEGNARDVAGCARVLVAADVANQKDAHEIEKYDRIDKGKATESVLLIDDLGEGNQA